MIKKFFSLFLIILLFCACSVEPAKDLTESLTPKVPTPSEPPTEKFGSTQSDFAVELLKENFKKDNILISPLSVKTALAMTLNGADKETKSQMEALLGMTVEELNEDILKYTSSLKSDKHASLHLANSIWFKDSDFTVKNDFLQATVDYYNAGIFKEPFDDDTGKKINNWVKENTDNMIEKIIDRIDENTKMYLINALAFEAKWFEPYEEYQVNDGSFTAISGETQNVEMMSSSEETYLEDDLATGFIKPYQGNYDFVALLPKGDIESYVASLSGDRIANILKNKAYYTVRSKLPKFSLDYSAELSDSLIKMGMPDAFDSDKADFSKMSDHPLYIDQVLHKTHITVNESGTRAAAVTAVKMNDGAAPMEQEIKEVYLDRPFVYMIVDSTNNLPIFMGVLTEVK